MVYWGPDVGLFESVFSALGHVQRGKMPRGIQGKGVELLRGVMRSLSDAELRVALSRLGRNVKDILDAANDLDGPEGERLRSVALSSPIIDSSRPLSLAADPSQEDEDEDSDSSRILKLLEDGPMSGIALGEALGRSETTMLRRLKELADPRKPGGPVVKRVGAGRGTKWKRRSDAPGK
jgi:biotin operon repressor